MLGPDGEEPPTYAERTSAPPPPHPLASEDFDRERSDPSSYEGQTFYRNESIAPKLSDKELLVDVHDRLTEVSAQDAFVALLKPDAPLAALQPAEAAVTQLLSRNSSDPMQCRKALDAFDKKLAVAGAAVLQLRIEHKSAAAGLAAQMVFDTAAGFHAAFECHFAYFFKIRPWFCTATQAAKMVKHLEAAFDVALEKPKPGLDDAIYLSRQESVLQFVGQLVAVSACAAFPAAFARIAMRAHRAAPTKKSARRAKFALEVSVLGAVVHAEMRSHAGLGWAPALRKRWRACTERTKGELRDYLELYLYMRDELELPHEGLIRPPRTRPSKEWAEKPPLEERLGARAYRMLLCVVHAFGAGTGRSELDAAQEARVLLEAAALGRAVGAADDAEYLDALGQWVQRGAALPAPTPSADADAAAEEGFSDESSCGVVRGARERGNAAMGGKRWDDALRAYDEGIAESETSGAVPSKLAEINAKLRGNRALAHLELGQAELALADGRAAAAAVPGWAKPRFRMGQALLAMGRAGEAVEPFEEAMASPDLGAAERREIAKNLAEAKLSSAAHCGSTGQRVTL